MVCDMVEQPRRVAERMATWLREGWCRQAIFNLKLPMKKRWDETRLCLDLVSEQDGRRRSEEHTSELQSLMRISYAVVCLQKQTKERTAHCRHPLRKSQKGSNTHQHK